MGSIRDIFLIGDTHLISGVAALLVVAFVVNLALGQFHVGLYGQPVAHSDFLWNFLGMLLAGLAFALAGDAQDASSSSPVKGTAMPAFSCWG